MEMNDKVPRVHWDEVTIQEHDQERGTRQTIDEAPTPYNYLSDEEIDESEATNGVKDAKANFEEGIVNPDTETVLTFSVQQNMENVASVESHDDSIARDSKTKEGFRNREEVAVNASNNDDGIRGEVYQHNASNSVSMRLLHSKLLLQKKDDTDHSNARHDEYVDPAVSSFKKKRASHYNEFAAMKASKQLRSDSEGDTEDDET